MNNDFVELMGMLVAIILGGCLIVLALSLPFALFGWILLAFINIFGAGIVYGYWTCVVAGLGLGILSGFLRR